MKNGVIPNVGIDWVAPIAGKPVAVVYRPTSAEKKPCIFSSPVSSVTLDYVAPLKEVKVAFRKTKGGYVAELSIPWKVIGREPKPGMRVPFDVQVIFSDAGGSINMSTAWWASRGPECACTMDLPTEAKLYPKLWGSLQLGEANR